MEERRRVGDGGGGVGGVGRGGEAIRSGPGEAVGKVRSVEPPVLARDWSVSMEIGGEAPARAPLPRLKSPPLPRSWVRYKCCIPHFQQPPSGANSSISSGPSNFRPQRLIPSTSLVPSWRSCNQLAYTIPFEGSEQRRMPTPYPTPDHVNNGHLPSRALPPHTARQLS